MDIQYDPRLAMILYGKFRRPIIQNIPFQSVKLNKFKLI